MLVDFFGSCRPASGAIDIEQHRLRIRFREAIEHARELDVIEDDAAHPHAGDMRRRIVAEAACETRGPDENGNDREQGRGDAPECHPSAQISTFD